MNGVITFKGVQYHHHKPTNFIMTGAVDDLWVDKDGEIVVVDYKATSKPAKVTLDADWQMSYKRQMEMYQWLLRQTGFKVSDTPVISYIATARADRESFDAKIDFDIDILPYTGESSWVEKALFEIKECLDGEMPMASPDCDHCNYRKAANAVDPN
jgi:CRISPR/Cas system-associated exonuclease Cas4 (RecB family)